MEGEDEDPFASIAKLCQIPPSQQLILRNCRFARESEFEVFSGYTDGVGGGGGEEQSQVNYGTAVESTGIVMVSPPETPKDESDTSVGGDDQFHTPPEGPNLRVGSEEQGIAFVDCRSDQEIDDGGGETLAVDVGGTEGEKMVDLGKDTALGFSEAQTLPLKLEEHRNTEVDCRSDDRVGGGDETVVVDGGSADDEKMVDLGKDSDQGISEIQNILILVSSEEHCNKVVDHPNEARIGGGETEAVDGGCADGEGIVELDKNSQGFLVVRQFKDDVSEQSNDITGEKPAKRLKFSKENLELPECSRARVEELEESEERIIRTVEDSESQTISSCELQSTNSLERNEVMWDEDLGLVSYNGPKVIDSELEQNRGVLGIGEATEKEDSTMKMDDCVDKEPQRDLKNVEDTEKFRHVGSSGTDSRKEARRQLPPSILGQVENVARGGNLVSSISSSVNHSFDCLMNVLKVFAERCEPKFDDADVLEIAMRRGMTFPRPIWWPAEFPPSWCPQGFGED